MITVWCQWCGNVRLMGRAVTVSTWPAEDALWVHVTVVA